MAEEIKRWKVRYSHKDGRSGEVEAVTEVGASGAFKYGNGKAGVLRIDGYANGYDLRYCREKDLHRAMLNEYFGDGIVSAEEV